MFDRSSLLIEVLASGWVVVVFTIRFGVLPSIAFPQASLASRLVGAFVRTGMTIAIGCSTQIARADQRIDAIVNTLCCVLLAAIAPDLLILLLFAGFGSIFGRQMALFTISITWTVLGVLAALPGADFQNLNSIVDPTYRHDRAPSGWTKLAATTLQLCETYRRNHPDRRIYYEKDRLRIYQFPARSRGSVPAPMSQ